MKIIKKGENNVTKGKPMGANERSDDNLEVVSGGFKTHNLSSGDYFVFNDAEIKRLIERVDGTFIWIPGMFYSCQTLSRILNCDCEVNAVKEALQKRGFKE